MKKHLIAAVIISVAGFGHAVPSYFYIDGAEAYNGYKIDFICADTGYREIHDGVLDSFNAHMVDDSAWSYSGATSWSEHYAPFNETAALIADGAATITRDAPEDFGSWQSAVFVLYANGVVPGGDYLITKTVYAYKESTFNLLNLSDPDNVLGSGKLRTDAVPEPTSGLLLLLGMAGLALRRRRA